ncbi:hypothetical protein QF018_005457, partial [Pseudomonas laurylsulfatiphila]
HRHTPNHCRSWLASDGGLPADQSLTDIRRTTVGAGLPAMAACQPTNLSQTYAEPLWERACQRRRPASRSNSHRHTPNLCGGWLAREGGLPADQSLTDIRRTTVGAGLPAKAAFQPTIFNSWPNILTPQPILPTPAISAPHTTPHLHDCSRSTTLQSRSPVAGQSPIPTRCRRCCGCGSFPRGRRVP